MAMNENIYKGCRTFYNCKSTTEIKELTYCNKIFFLPVISVSSVVKNRLFTLNENKYEAIS